MPPSGPDASNSCIPAKSPIIKSVPPLPSPQRGERCPLDGESGRNNSSQPLLMYGSNKYVVVRTISTKPIPLASPATKAGTSASSLPVLVYRGHRDTITSCKFSPSGCYCATGDERGTVRVWSYDQEEHLCKYEMTTAITGPIRDLDWDGESKRIAIVGERAGSDPNGDCAKVIQWDTGVTVGQLGNHLKGRAASVSMKGTRPFRLVTGGKDDFKTNFHKGPPFQKVPSTDNIPSETAHAKGAVCCIRYNHANTFVISVGTDRAICLYDGTTFELKQKIDSIHAATVYSCAWSQDDKYVLTSSGDGTCKLLIFDGTILKEIHTWHVAATQLGMSTDGTAPLDPTAKIPIGGTQLGCAFIQGGQPISVGYNGQISILPLPKSVKDENAALASLSLDSSSSVKVITGHYAPVSSMDVDWDNKKIYTADTDGIICRWDLDTCEPEQRIVPSINSTATSSGSPSKKPGEDNLMYIIHNGAIAGLTIAKGHVMSVGWDDTMYITEPPHTGSRVKGKSIALGAQPVTIARGVNIALIVTVNGLLLAKNHDGSISDMVHIDYEPSPACVIDQNDQYVFIGSKNTNHIYVYAVYNTPTEWTVKLKHTIMDCHLKPIQSMCISNNGQMLASADERDVCVFDITSVGSSGQIKPIINRGRWCFHVQRITSLSWNADDTVLASGGADDSIYLWNVSYPMKRIHYPFAHRGGIVKVCFHKSKSKGMILYTTGVDSVVNVWDVTTDIRDKFK
jgi:WD repeat-containing protein 1 (actin-interacting protein 1)